MKKLKLFKPREKFLVLAVGPAGTDGLFLSVDEDRNIIFEKRVKNIDLKKFFASPMRNVTQKSWEGAYLFKSHRKVIAAVDSSLATTIPIPLDLPREHGAEHTEVVLPELENLIAQAMGKIFNQCRSEAAKRLAIHEIDTIMVGAKARGFKMDGHQVVNPVGFTGKKISLLLELTFTGRVLFRDLRQFFNAPDDFFFAESAQARLAALARGRKLPLNLIVDEGARGASLFVLEKTKDGHPVLYRERMEWNFNVLFTRIAAELGINDGTAREMYRAYLGKAMSESATRAFKKIIDPAVDQFLKEVGKGRLKGFIYVDAEHDLPFPLPHKRGTATFDRFPLAEILQQLGFMDREGNRGSDAVISRHLLPFIEAYFDKSNSEINQKLRRRLHWLAD
ncbi:MAG TPA: hypothetical protein VIJ29_00615 [Candidatus Paceibacterota bacterium]